MTLPPADLPPGVDRVLVVGSSGAGKTTMAAALGARLGLPHTELDSLWHGPGWEPRPEFERDIEAMLATGRWVTEYQYRPVKDRLLDQAQAVVWLDHPFPLVAARLLRRSAVRAVTRRAYWNGNRENVAMWLHASHPLRIVLSREFWAKRRRTEVELAGASARGAVVIGCGALGRPTAGSRRSNGRSDPRPEVESVAPSPLPPRERCRRAGRRTRRLRSRTQGSATRWASRLRPAGDSPQSGTGAEGSTATSACVTK